MMNLTDAIKQEGKAVRVRYGDGSTRHAFRHRVRRGGALQHALPTFVERAIDSPDAEVTVVDATDVDTAVGGRDK